MTPAPIHAVKVLACSNLIRPANDPDRFGFIGAAAEERMIRPA